MLAACVAFLLFAALDHTIVGVISYRANAVLSLITGAAMTVAILIYITSEQ